jgi:DNA-binding IclR family transcriptional regulator
MPIVNDWSARKVMRFVFDATRDPQRGSVAIDEAAARALVLPPQDLKRLAETLTHHGMIREVESDDHVALTERGELVVTAQIMLARRWTS